MIILVKFEAEIIFKETQINDEEEDIINISQDIKDKIENGELQPYINEYGFECYK